MKPLQEDQESTKKVSQEQEAVCEAKRQKYVRSVSPHHSQLSASLVMSRKDSSCFTSLLPLQMSTNSPLHPGRPGGGTQLVSTLLLRHTNIY